ncbi:MAG: hypothetical protein MJZ92_02205 [Paludibacteraceae bacterium]|nr:hypothetical protein [Paludibacteraceae bacterium]
MKKTYFIPNTEVLPFSMCTSLMVDFFSPTSYGDIQGTPTGGGSLGPGTQK